MTKQLLWEEYTEQYEPLLQLLTVLRSLRHWHQPAKRSMRQSHKAGEKCFVDYAGQTVAIVCAHTGEIRPAQVFVAVLKSPPDYSLWQRNSHQSLPDWFLRAFEYFGGCTAIVVPDKLKSLASRACRYDPVSHPSYQQWAEHCQVAVNVGAAV